MTLHCVLAANVLLLSGIVSSLPRCMSSQFVDTAIHVQVYLPSALTGGSTSSDPKIRELNNELNEVNRKILNNDLEIPPEGERSPSPEPIYDRNGKQSPSNSLASPRETGLHIRSRHHPSLVSYYRQWGARNAWCSCAERGRCSKELSPGLCADMICQPCRGVRCRCQAEHQGGAGEGEADGEAKLPH